MPLAPPVTIETRPSSLPMLFLRARIIRGVSSPAKAGDPVANRLAGVYWMPAFAGMTPRGTHMDAATLLDRLTIRQLVEDWAVLRDARLWDRFREVWHDDGRMMATWFQGSRDEFIKVSEEGYQKGVRILHFLGGSTIDLSGVRAIAQTKMTISQRAKVDGVLCDVVCTGRFYDF